MRLGLLGQGSERHEEQPSAEELEILDDSEIDRLYHSTMKKIAVDSRR